MFESPVYIAVIFFSRRFRLTMKILRATILATATVVCLLSAAVARKAETGLLDRTISVGGATDRYQVFVPSNWDAHKKWNYMPVLSCQNQE